MIWGLWPVICLAAVLGTVAGLGWAISVVVGMRTLPEPPPARPLPPPPVPYRTAGRDLTAAELAELVAAADERAHPAPAPAVDLSRLVEIYKRLYSYEPIKPPRSMGVQPRDFWDLARRLDMKVAWDSRRASYYLTVFDELGVLRVHADPAAPLLPADLVGIGLD